MFLPKVSIVIPAFNRAKYLEKTILSVLDQNYSNLELIIVDGGSNDGTLSIIEKHKAHIHYFISEPDQGMYYALQKGFEKSTGEIMAWINSDDLYHLNSLHIVSKIFSDLPNVEWISGMPAFYNNNSNCVKIHKPVFRTKEHFLIGDYKWIQQENIFWKRSLWERAGSKFNLENKLAGDFELWSRYFTQANLYFVETSFAGFRLHGEQLSINKKEQYEIEAENIHNLYITANSTSLKLRIFRYLFKLKSKCLKSNKKMSKLLIELITLYLNKRLKVKNNIYYNFDINKWEY
ncbi:MAG: glycosyltransferase family 2 protein [Bacteroidota bacterium]|nr:glycosyltransferase family 2 protein [Bacteroidota bacterium]MDP3144348.1 glycosyltransferase family 2 protein [Bacteroidota bacterium]